MRRPTGLADGGRSGLATPARKDVVEEERPLRRHGSALVYRARTAEVGVRDVRVEVRRRRRPGWAAVAVAQEYRAVRMQGVGMLRAKALASVLASGYDSGALGHRFPCWGRHVGDTTLLHRVLWVKTLSSSWMSDGGVFGVVPSLEASSLENQLDFGIADLSVMVGFNQRWQVCCVVSWMGVADPTRRRLRLWWRSEVVACLLVVAACSGPWWLALLGNSQCGVGLRWRTSLAASASWDDLACSGPWRVAQLGWAIQYGTSSQDGASDYFGSLKWRWRFHVWVKHEGEVNL
jgi:hypothetical protein